MITGELKSKIDRIWDTEVVRRSVAPRTSPQRGLQPLAPDFDPLARRRAS